MLPDDVLLVIFDFCVVRDSGTGSITLPGMAWVLLAHVCRRWRSVVFESPCRLNMQLVCIEKTPARDTLDIWPPLPLQIWNRGSPIENVDNIIAVLERSDRVCYISLMNSGRSDLEKLLAAMQVPFLELTRLLLWSVDETVSALPDSFLGGSAPRLEDLFLDFLPFPGLPKLLLSATHLIHLRLDDIPHSGYFSPEAIVTALSALTHLETLWLRFTSPQSRPDPAHQRPPPPTRSVLPALTWFSFKGVNEYLEVVVARINAPRLDTLTIVFFNDIVFDTPQLTHFISCTPMLKTFTKARITFEGGAASIDRLSRSSYKGLQVKILCEKLDWQISSMEQVCTSCLPPLSMLEDLYIKIPRPQPNWQDNIENALWLDLLHPFSTVKNLYLSKEITPRIVPALQEVVAGGMTEVLPTLQNILLEEGQSLGPLGPVQEGIQQFIAMRQDTGHPIAVHYGHNFNFDI